MAGLGSRMVEIERKFRVTTVDRTMLGVSKRIMQSYLSFNPEVRVRIIGNEGYLTVKGEGTLTRTECECPIPELVASKLLRMAEGRPIEKVRCSRDRWEVDFYDGHLKGLVIAEIEMESESEQVFLPAWMKGYEVTHDSRYKNQQLARIESLTVLDGELHGTSA